MNTTSLPLRSIRRLAARRPVTTTLLAARKQGMATLTAPLYASSLPLGRAEATLGRWRQGWNKLGRSQNTANSNPNSSRKRLYQVAGATAAALAAAQYSLGHADDFFEHKFVTTAKSEDLADFYGTEDLMEIFCVFPMIGRIMMRGAEFDDVGNIHARGLLGANDLEVSIDFDEREVDTTGDGEPDTIAWFNKRETFHDVAPAWLGGFTLWKQTQNFGYHRLDNGTCEVYHHGEHFEGLFPIRLIFQIHARYVIWATERYLNSKAFGGAGTANDEEDDAADMAEEYRQNVPLHVFKEYVAGLTQQVQETKNNTSESNTKKHEELAATLQRLNTLSANLESEEDDEGASVYSQPLQERRASKITLQTAATKRSSVPRLSTVQTKRDSRRNSVRLIVNDAETSDTLRMAMKQIGSGKGQSHEPVARMQELQRHTTLAEVARRRRATIPSTHISRQDTTLEMTANDTKQQED